MIWEELKDSLIFTGLEAGTSDDVMKQLGAAFIKEGYCKDTYVEALMKRESEFPTGLDVDGIGVAIPHTDVSHVKEPGIAIAVLKNPVTFIQMGTDDETTQVRLVFMLAVKDPNAHLENLQQIIAIIQDTDVLKKLLEVNEKKEIIEIIREKENLL
ncbi:PTS sugar transporter subunit IIA [Faecalicatena sp. AGMB00832]|uniref:PTS sugar transporter subunit IIA n=1 Tax=Faecalicatena faecalis TaxID=2726362 RepID=A0ABS6D024_9FIRM|nr:MULTISPECIES: PTS sugar transporter subunit IIA [Faecalicatena]MBU3874572.1 PTS sugar transporter subunit IIA [Faecalicatena faecalis]MCI6464769.1 PTS sugar transporter subunit IIA [Faecalicatena sp.]MDY5621071.1 PTS sugar transporter subunit IIA [Lachnospiraceae bacterium]